MTGNNQHEGGLPIIGTTDSNPRNKFNFTISHIASFSDRVENNEEEISQYLRFTLTIVNVICLAVFVPLNWKMARGLLHISTRKQPMFLLFVIVLFVCSGDLMTSIADVTMLWVKVPDWLCKILGIISLSVYCCLSFTITSICFYR